MARLIDADVACKGCVRYGTDLSCENCVVNDAPTVDAVEVVRCRECKHYETADFDGDILCGCTLHSAMLDITPDSFCSYGERKEGADDE